MEDFIPTCLREEDVFVGESFDPLFLYPFRLDAAPAGGQGSPVAMII
jgi:hypothetical protein